MPDTLHIGLLGPLTAVIADGERIALASLVQRRLLTVLALQDGRALSAAHLEDLMACTPGSLRTIVSRLRGRLGAEHLTTIPPGYALVAQTDVAEFEQLLATARTVSGGAAVDLLDRAVGLWRGAAVEEFADEGWAVADAVRLEELRSTAVELRAEAMLADGRPERAVAEMRAHVVRHPLRERPRGVLMRALAASGRPTEALRVYQELRRHLIDEIGTEPSEEIRAIEREVAAGMVGAPVGSPPTTLPAQRTSLFGRDDLVERVRDLLVDHRLVTLIGPGGVGKTRLAIEIAATALGRFPGGVYFADLTRAGTGPEVTSEVLRAMKLVPRSPQTDDDAIAAFLADRVALLVVDNCEHVVDRAAEVIDDLLVAAPHACVIATSREPLALRGERRLVVPSLDVGGPTSAGVRLFTDRAAAIDEDALSDDDLPTVVEIARRLDGIPLAIELAAAQVATLDPQTILEHLDDRFALLTGRLRRVPLRQQTLAAAIDWSYQRLDPEEQRAFRLLSAGSGPLSSTTAARLLDRTEADTDRLVNSLAAKSLLVEVGADGERLGWTFLESLREYGRERTTDHEEIEGALLALEQALLPTPEATDDWILLVNRYLCAPDPSMMIEDVTRLAAADRALAGGRLDSAALLYSSVAYRDDFGALKARSDVVKGLTERTTELAPTVRLVASATELLLARSTRDYGVTFEIATTILAGLEPGHPARGWFDVWRCALIEAVDPRAGLAEVDAVLPEARRHACLPLDWTMAQLLMLKGTGAALLGDLDEADRWATEAATWAPMGVESRDQVIALRLWIGYLRGRPIAEELLLDVADQPHDLGLTELCAAPAALCAGGPLTARAAALVAAARQRPTLDIPTPFLLAFALLAIEEGDLDRAAALLATAELYDASTHVALTYANAAIRGSTPATWDEDRDAMVVEHLSIDHETAAERGADALAGEVHRWERRLDDTPSVTPR